jgi:hypothetical protein
MLMTCWILEIKDSRGIQQASGLMILFKTWGTGGKIVFCSASRIQCRWNVLSCIHVNSTVICERGKSKWGSQHEDREAVMWQYSEWMSLLNFLHPASLSWEAPTNQKLVLNTPADAVAAVDGWTLTFILPGWKGLEICPPIARQSCSSVRCWPQQS